MAELHNVKTNIQVKLASFQWGGGNGPKKGEIYGKAVILNELEYHEDICLISWVFVG